MRLIQWLLAVTALGCSAPASALLVDFNHLAQGSTFTSYAQYDPAYGVTFTRVGGGPMTAITTPNGTRGLFAGGAPIRADIAGGTNLFTLDLGDFSEDRESLYVEAYESSGRSIGGMGLGFDGSGMRVLGYRTFEAPNIAYVIFGSRDPSAPGNDVYADNFLWWSPVIVPEPGTGLLFAALLAVAGASRRRLVTWR